MRAQRCGRCLCGAVTVRAELKSPEIGACHCGQCQRWTGGGPYFAASVDGASGWQLFKNITWPQLTPAVNTNFLLNIVGSLQAWILFLVLVGYRNGTQVLGYVVYAEGFGQTGGAGAAFRQGYAAAASIVLFLLVLVLGMAANFIVTRRERKYLG